MTARVLSGIVVAAVLATVATPAHAAERPLLADTAGTRFPQRELALTVPAGTQVSPARVQATENGRPVRRVSIEAASGAAARRFGVVLTIDTSGSMRGAGLRAAVAAARQFVARRALAQPIAIVTFAGQVRVALPFTTDPVAIDRTLSAVKVGPGGSRLLDATARAAQLLAASRITSGSIVALTDGADHRSVTALQRVVADARSANARVYAIGASSHSRNFGALNLLAAETGGEFSAATSFDDLARIYSRLGSRLQHQYLLHYRSTAGSGEHVTVRVHIAGVRGTLIAAYRAPVAPPPAPFRHSPVESLWLSPAMTLLTCLLAGLLLVAAIWALLRRRGSTVRERMAAYVAEAEPEEERSKRVAMLTERVRGEASEPLRRARWMLTLRERLDVGRVAIPAERLVTWVAAGTVALLILLPLMTGTVVAALLAPALPVLAHVLVLRRVAKQRRLFTEQLPDNLQVMASAMRAGHSFAGALSVMVDDAPEPTRTELGRVLADERLGVPIDAALHGAVRRMESRDLEQVALVAALQQQTGGNTAEVLERVTDNVRNRVALRRQVRTLTAQGRMSRWVLTGLPIGLLAIVTTVNPDYVQPLFATSIGKVLLLASGTMLVAGSLVIGRIVNIRV